MFFIVSFEVKLFTYAGHCFQIAVVLSWHCCHVNSIKRFIAYAAKASTRVCVNEW